MPCALHSLATGGSTGYVMPGLKVDAGVGGGGGAGVGGGGVGGVGEAGVTNFGLSVVTKVC